MQGRTRLTAGRVAAFACPAGKSQAFLWDTDAPALMVRATPKGRKTYAFESRLHGATVRITIGDVAAWTLEAARQRANALRQQTDAGIDPREVERQQQAEQAEQERQQIEAERRESVTVADAWADYLEARRPYWGERHYADHGKLIAAGGEPAKRGTRGRGVTVAGPLHSLAGLKLGELDSDTMKAWAKREAQTRPTSARLALRCFRAFLAWCGEEKAFAGLVDTSAASGKDVREALGKPKAKDDSLLREQLPGWFAAVRDLGNPMQSAYLQTLLLTGARPGEVLGLRWDDLNVQWKGLTIRDKVEGERVIPLTPYVHSLLAGLPRRGPWVFAGTSAEGEIQPISKPHKAHARACAVAGIEGLTFHGLRRSFGTLTEWLEIPAGVVAQIQGHKPSATAEKHYRVRPLDLLRLHHERIEAWMLEQAGIEFQPQAEPGKLRAVK
jgi:integrase